MEIGDYPTLTIAQRIKRFVAAVVVFVVSLFVIPSECGLLEALPVSTARPCTIDGYVALTTLWVNLGVIYIALFDRELLRDILWPLIKILQVLLHTIERIRHAVDAIRREAKESEPESRSDLAEEGKEEGDASAAAAAKKAGADARIARVKASWKEARANPKAMQKREKASWDRFVALLGVAIVVLCFVAALAARPEQTPQAVPEEATQSQSSTLAPPPAQSRKFVVEAGSNCWRVARECTGEGRRWRELLPANEGLRVEGARCVVQPQQELVVPADWRCE